MQELENNSKPEKGGGGHMPYNLLWNYGVSILPLEKYVNTQIQVYTINYSLFYGIGVIQWIINNLDFK